MWINEGTYQTRDKASALITKAFPLKERDHCLQEERTFSTASIQGCQLSSSRSPGPTKTPSVLILTEDQSSETGGSSPPAQPPNQRLGSRAFLINSIYFKDGANRSIRDYNKRRVIRILQDGRERRWGPREGQAFDTWIGPDVDGQHCRYKNM